MQPDERAAYLAQEARQADPDRYLCALLAPAERRAAVMALVLFNHELARVPEIVTQPMAGLIRYQWWREAIDEVVAGRPPRQHPVVEELAVALQRSWMGGSELQALIDAREPVLDGMTGTDPASLEAFATATSGNLQALIYRLLGGADEREAAAAAKIGTGCGLLAIARAVRAEAADRERKDELEGRSDILQARAAALVAEGRAEAGRPRRELMAAFLPGALMHGQARLPPGAAIGRPVLAPIALAVRALLRWP